MQELKGKYGSAKIFTGTIEASVSQQLQTLLDHPVSRDAHVRIMPDCHAGAGCVIGFTALLTDKVVPNLIGVDIGCGVCAWELDISGAINFPALDRYIRTHIPSGHSVRSNPHPLLERLFTPEFREESFSGFTDRLNRAIGKTGQENGRVWASVGSLGGGNHFIEIDSRKDGKPLLLVHSGSRNFGLQIAGWHQKKALGQCGKMDQLEYLTGSGKDEYLEDMKLAQLYAGLNRRVIGHDILSGFFGLGDSPAGMLESVHNYINFKDNIIRKGAISAHSGEELLIPLNMAEGVIIGKGKGNPDWNFSAPHGAGRKLSRTQARKQVSPADFQRVMEENRVWTSCAGRSTLDEAPQAYKNADMLIADLEPAVEILSVLRPLYNFKAH